MPRNPSTLITNNELKRFISKQLVEILTVARSLNVELITTVEMIEQQAIALRGQYDQLPRDPDKATLAKAATPRKRKA